MMSLQMMSFSKIPVFFKNLSVFFINSPVTVIFKNDVIANDVIFKTPDHFQNPDHFQKPRLFIWLSINV